MTKYIDFSSKHNILIANSDGTYSRMDEPYFMSELIAPNTWKVLSSGDYSYLVVGDGVGISIDCGYGAGNIREYLESLCGVPVPYVTNTHDHFDHSANNAYFDMAFLNEKAKEFGTIPYASFAGIDFPRDYPVTIIHDGDFIPLKGRELQALSIPDHAPSSMMYLDRKERILFSGDEIMPMGKSLNGGLKSWIENLEKIDKYRDEFDVLYGGGGRLDKKLFGAFLECARYAWDHEGELLPPPTPRKPRFIHEDPEGLGRTVYDRRMPHPGDSASYPDEPEILWENLRKVEYAGTSIVYDLSRKFE
ncbi:MAG: MBL fold metallo-hydrolase [Ruminococcus sp.]|nr:MBL fold metallo-hydrolase [Ruminococcus sp.]